MTPFLESYNSSISTPSDPSLAFELLRTGFFPREKAGITQTHPQRIPVLQPLVTQGPAPCDSGTPPLLGHQVITRQYRVSPKTTLRVESRCMIFGIQTAVVCLSFS